MPASETIAALTAALAAEREARQQAEARASGAEALVAYYKLSDRQAAARPVRAILRAQSQTARPAGIAARGSRGQRRRGRDRGRAGRQHDGAPVHPQEAGAGAVSGASAAR